MKHEDVIKCYDFCTCYLDKLNRNQCRALYRYFEMKHKDIDMLFTDKGRVACLYVLSTLKAKATDEDSVDNYSIWTKLTEAWTFMLGMLMVQDEYNRYNPNYKSPIK